MALTRHLLRLAEVALLAALIIIPAGCDVVSVLGTLSSHEVVAPAYMGLKGKSVAIMAWADPASRYEYGSLVLDVTRTVQSKLKAAQKSKATELDGTVFPMSAGPEAVARFQEDHPELAADPVETIAPRLGVDRLIYIELGPLNLHSGAVTELFRGTLSASINVIEVSGGKGKKVYQGSVDASFPRQTAEEGDPNLTTQAIYQGTLDQFCVSVAEKFVSHPNHP